MKTIHLIFLLILLISIKEIHSQIRWLVEIPGYSHTISLYNNAYGSANGYLICGKNNNTYYRSYIYWPNINSYLPANAIITNVKF